MVISNSDLIFKRSTAQVDDHEFAMCIFASGDGFSAANPCCRGNYRQVAKGRQRQLSSLATDPVSGWLVRLELSGPEQRNAAQAEYHRLAASV
ncbi:hypothetical protein JJE66_19850 [Bradyrhizobium diazoefficiens]|uniref:hypothetical protein n=1 Tax=Bradyrhizobium diazoefficiens TaxID=1355477 RepID=UPI00190D59E0|nr:hypothetical protein [Bradyrhizobium diazoefficiens]MBK3663465.1 hypothetical protein [Bradyrhizobium diazoefficiens]